MAKKTTGKRGKPFDVTFKHLVEAHPEDVLRFVHVADFTSVELIDADLSTVVAAADKVLKVHAAPGDYLVHLEFQTGRDGKLIERLFWYNSLLYRRHCLPVWTVLVLLTRAADSPRRSGAFEVRLPGAGTMIVTFGYQVVRLWETRVDSILDGPVGLLPMAPLCDDAELRLDEVARRIQRRGSQELTPAEQKEMWAAVYWLMGMRFDRATILQFLPKGQAMKESVTYQATLAEGARRIVIRVGRKRLGEPKSAALRALESIEDPEKLEELVEHINEASSWEALLGQKPPKKNGRRKP